MFFRKEVWIIILVTGATSRVGTRLVPMLLSRGIAVRIMTRTPEKAGEMKKLGAEVVQGDLRDPASLARASGAGRRARL